MPAEQIGVGSEGMLHESLTPLLANELRAIEFGMPPTRQLLLKRFSVWVADYQASGTARNLQTVAEVLPWLQEAIAKHYPDSKCNVGRMAERPDDEPEITHQFVQTGQRL
jgi:hypothetical protein